MMLFSRFWYAILAIVGGAALYASWKKAVSHSFDWAT